ncbi:sugar ABC transporter permease [Bullifex porci]|uniref:ABC transporter permease n=1 Tax=Bullifex porci TaxID=2606638 RepID=UPI0023F3C148|nr:ABC transporter permease subunit [Bullifex porci]MDD7255013.1 ABC transporter permease subunit [Bullifex porci]MDD7271905.1 ABC transporter permease subunit [Spirochaetales bacterium]MDY2740618.1 ABC transporter permease subunit [Bullifex porci]
MKKKDELIVRRDVSLAKRLYKCWPLYVFLLPGVIWYIMFCYKPMIGLRMAFYDYNIFRGFSGSKFVGLENFKIYMSSPDFGRTLKNTLMIAVWQMVICFPVPVILAILITEMKSKIVSKMVQTISFLPHFISTVVVCGMVVNFLSPSTGIINMILGKFGIEAKYFMVYPQYFRPIYTIMTLWQTAGFNAIVYIAALMGIDPQLYEAAIVDGAGRWRRIINITIPGIIPTVVTMFIMNIGKMVKVGYESILLLYEPSTYATADVISTYSFRMGIQNGDYGVATAAGLFEAVIALILVVAANKVSKRLTETALW